MSPHSDAENKKTTLSNSEVSDIFVLRMSRYEVTILTSVLVESADVVAGELSFLRGDAFEEGNRLRDGFNGLLAKFMDMR